MKIDITGFLGASLAIDPRLLPASIGVSSLNQRPGYGDFRPWNLPGASVATVPSAQKTIYRMGQTTNESASWLSWSTVVNVVRTYDAKDTAETTFYTGDGAPKFTNATLALTTAPYPTASRPLGLPAPTAVITATVAVAATTGSDQAFSWVYTYVNDLGWESAPSAPSADILAKGGTTFNLAGFAAAPGGYGIVTVRLYRFVPGQSTAGGYFFLREWAVGATPANPIDDARAAGSDQVATSGFRPCPGVPNGGALLLTEPNAIGIKAWWNGIFGVGVGKSVRLCHPYTPYAWPLAYEIGLTAEFVAQGIWGQRAIILTTGDATIVAGSSPDAMDDEPAKINRPCSSAQSVVEFNEGAEYKGVAWASEECLCWYGDDGFRNLTADALTQDQWRAMNPASMIASRYRGFYICFYNDGALKGFVIDPRTPGSIYYLSPGYDAIHRDRLTDRLYVLEGTNIKRWDAGVAMTATFKSKVFNLPSPGSIGVISFISNGHPITVKVYGNGRLRYTRTLTKDQDIRPVGGWKGKDLQFEISSSKAIVSMRAATSVDELRQA